MATSKKKTTERLPQHDPRAPLDGQALLQAARPVLKVLETDLLQRADSSPGVTTALKARHAADKKAERTADNYATWRRAFIEQVAAAWFLSVVFVRTLEDRGLIERNRIAGEGALDSQKSFFALAPSLSERDYLLTVFKELSHLPAAAELFDAKHNPVWLLAPSAEAAQQLLALFRSGSDVFPAFRFGGDTRFLGDLYQDLSENVRKRYALLQTPRFVESYILDKTLEPAIKKFGLDAATLIDPTCGSGHFLLGAFERLLHHRLLQEPGVDARQSAKKALDAIAGLDINPYAISIARFRLTLAFVEQAKYDKLKDAPQLPLHLAVTDSLLHNPQKGLELKGKTSDLFAQVTLGEQVGADRAAWEGEIFSLEDKKATEDVLGTVEKPKRYAAVVGNPPYITVKDAVLRDRYRAMYSSAYMEYSLAVPFKERFFQLGREGACVGMITANSFMKRQFGKKVIEEYLPTVNLTSIVNTSGAYIPGHGTPTVMLFGTCERPKTSTVHTILASRGEPSTPEDPEQGMVWRSIADHGDETGFENDYISVTETKRSDLAQHPWSLSGGGATELKALLEERAEQRLQDVVDVIGFVCMTRADDIYFTPRGALRRAGIDDKYIVENVEGEVVRDWALHEPNTTVFPYDEDLVPTHDVQVHRFLWPYRTLLWLRREPNGNHKEIGLTWWEWSRFQRERFTAPLKITFAFVATHNHFVLDRGGKVFKQSAPIIKLPASATEDDHYALLAYLNSSTACFWMKQVCHNKTNASQKHSTDPARAAYEFAGTALEGLPILAATSAAVQITKELDTIGPRRSAWLSGAEFLRNLDRCRTKGDIERVLKEGWSTYDQITARAVYLQEELDWCFYRAARLTNEDLPDLDPNGRAHLGQRPFEAEDGYRSGVSERAERTALDVLVGVVPPHWESRKVLITGNLRTLEDRSYKRFWRETEQNVDLREFRASLPRLWLKNSLASTIEQSLAGPQAATLRMLRDIEPTLNLASEYIGDSSEDLGAAILESDSVPFLETYVYTDTGLEKRAAWRATWEAQRAEDRGENAAPAVPPEYSQGSRGKSKDYRKDGYWRLRGKLDVPKERFISYPGCESDEDGEPVYGWAGWNHRQRAVALATLYAQRKNEEGWAKERLQPMLAGILELLPWLVQWHGEPDDEFDGAIPALQFREFLEAECAAHGFTFDDLRAWRPPEKKRAGSATKKSSTQASKREPE